MKAHVGCGCKGAHTYEYTAMSLGKVRVASRTLGHLYPRYSFYRRLSGSQEQSGHEGVKEISTPPTPGTEPGPSSPWRNTLPLEPHDSLRKPWLEYNHLFPTLEKCIFSETSELWLIFSLVSAKLPCLPPSSCHKREKLPLWVQKA